MKNEVRTPPLTLSERQRNFGHQFRNVITWPWLDFFHNFFKWKFGMSTIIGFFRISKNYFKGVKSTFEILVIFLDFFSKKLKSIQAIPKSPKKFDPNFTVGPSSQSFQGPTKKNYVDWSRNKFWRTPRTRLGNFGLKTEVTLRGPKLPKNIC